MLWMNEWMMCNGGMYDVDGMEGCISNMSGMIIMEGVMIKYTLISNV